MTLLENHEKQERFLINSPPPPKKNMGESALLGVNENVKSLEGTGTPILN